MRSAYDVRFDTLSTNVRALESRLSELSVFQESASVSGSNMSLSGDGSGSLKAEGASSMQSEAFTAGQAAFGYPPAYPQVFGGNVQASSVLMAQLRCCSCYLCDKLARTRYN